MRHVPRPFGSCGDMRLATCAYRVTRPGRGVGEESIGPNTRTYCVATMSSDARAAPKQVVKRAIPARWQGPLFGTIGSVFYAGTRLTCPCCGGHFRDFRLEGRVCPRCGSLG